MPQLKPSRGSILRKPDDSIVGRIIANLVAYYALNEGSGAKVFDLSGKGNTGTIGSGFSWGAGDYGSVITGTAIDRIVIANESNFDFERTDSFSVLVRFKSTGYSYSLLGKMHHAAPYTGWDVEIDGTAGYQGRIAFYLINTWSTSVIQVRGTNTYNDGKEHTVIVTYDGTSLASGVKMYIDGLLEVPNVGLNSLSASILNNVSASIAGRSGGRYLSGSISFAMIFKRILSSSEIALLYREPFCMFERAWIPKLISGQIIELIGTSAALSSLSATAKATRKVSGNVLCTSGVAALLTSIRSLTVVESNWLREALFNGMTANAFKLGTTLSLGWFWVRVAGCTVLYRGSSMGEIDFANILAVAEQDACEISPPSYISHNSDSTYFYVVRRFNNCGYQERTLSASVKVSIESNGNLAEPQPNNIFCPKVEQVNGNKIQLVWFYCPLEQKSQPMCFNVYYDGRTGQIDYENPLAIIDYKERKFYSYKYGALEAGRYLFAIRTEDTSGIENSSLARLRIQFDTTNPNAIDILSAEAV